MQTVRLAQHQWTALPGTTVVVWWDGEQAITVARQGEFWSLAPLAVPGRVLAWARLADRPELGAWPIVPLGRRAVYRSPRGRERGDL